MSARRPSRPGASSARPGSSNAPRTGSTSRVSPRSGANQHRSAAKPRTAKSASGPGATSSTRPQRRPEGRVPVTAASASGGSLAAIWPRVLTVRAFVLFIVLLLAFIMLLPTLRGYLGQRAELQTMRSDLVAAEERQDELEFQLGRWKDDAFVASQARERLAYVYPGETAFRVLDPESVLPSVNPDTGKAVEDGILDVGSAATPWYAAIWDSVAVAGEVEPVGPADQDGAEPDGGAPDSAK